MIQNIFVPTWKKEKIEFQFHFIAQSICESSKWEDDIVQNFQQVKKSGQWNFEKKGETKRFELFIARILSNIIWPSLTGSQAGQILYTTMLYQPIELQPNLGPNSRKSYQPSFFLRS